MSGGPWSSSLACAFLRQETVVRAAVEALFEILAEKVSWIRNLRKQLNGLLKNVAKTLFRVVSIAVFSEVSFEKNEKVIVKSTLLVI